jgi:enoyl-CoA hydratase/carnithine racemase
MDDPSAQVLRVSTNDGYRELTFDRPGALNAFNQDLWYAAAQALDDAAEDDEVRCVLLTGSGRAFSAGQDLGEMSNPAAFADRPPGYQRFMPSLETFPTAWPSASGPRCCSTATWSTWPGAHA